MAYGYGIGSDGAGGWRQLPEHHFEQSLSAMSAFIRNIKADIVLLQEVDFDSKRSCRMNQLEILSRRSNLLYHNPCISWDHAYVPYPGLNPLHHFGKVLSGGGILSRFPIRKLESDLLPKPRENHPAYNHFYLNRYLQIVETGGIRLCNLHLEAFSKANRELHLIRLQDRLRDFEIDLAGGDFNGSIDLNEECAQDFSPMPAPSPTFPSDHPIEKIDGFIVKKKRFQSIQVSVYDTGVFSDHFPVLIELD
jgi:endonuclease/exonuclease/phosphatase family metal-dependent hydrolase